MAGAALAIRDFLKELVITAPIYIRFFWLHQLIELEGIIFRHVPRDHMVADQLTKPLVGNPNLFIYLSNFLNGSESLVNFWIEFD